jgi:hypothetical protein
LAAETGSDDGMSQVASVDLKFPKRRCLVRKLDSPPFLDNQILFVRSIPKLYGALDY